MTLREAFPEAAAPPRTATPPSPEIAGLTSVRALLARGWTQHYLQLDDHFCLLGAIDHVVPGIAAKQQVAYAVAETIRREEGGLWRYVREWPPFREWPVAIATLASRKRRAALLIIGFNDHDLTQHRDVLRVIDRTIERRTA